MSLEALELLVGIEERIAIVEVDDQPDDQKIVLHAVYEAASNRPSLQWEAEGVHDVAGGYSAWWNPPDFLDAECIGLRVAARTEVETLLEQSADAISRASDS